MFSVKGKKVLVIGLGISGSAAAHFLVDQGAHVHGVDRNVINDIKGITIALDSSPCDVAGFDLVVVSPGIPRIHPLYQAAIGSGVETIGEIELGCRFINQPMIGITGTNGKTTVTLLITHVLNKSRFKAKALGNVGLPLTKEIAHVSKDDILVVELSSYQLETLSCQVLDAAVILNITPDHLDRYPDMEAYAKAKFHIASCLKPGAPVYVEAAAMKNYGSLFHGTSGKTYGYSSNDDIFTDLRGLFVNGEIELTLPKAFHGEKSHDIENMMAAYAICRQIGVMPEQFFEALESFKKPSHRIEFILRNNGISYYDDSKGTNIDAVIRAVEQMDGPVVLIAGGVDKGSAYTPWIEAFNGKVKRICAIGQAAKKIEKDLSHAVSVKIYDSLEGAVRAASDLAEDGDSVLLSPGCSSFDMFRDYAHRGEEFQRLVNHLAVSKFN